MIRFLLIALLLVPSFAIAGQGMGPGPGVYHVPGGNYQTSTFETGDDDWVFSTVSYAPDGNGRSTNAAHSGTWGYVLTGGKFELDYQDGTLTKTLTIKAGGKVSLWVMGTDGVDSYLTVEIDNDTIIDSFAPAGIWTYLEGDVPAGVDATHTVRIINHYSAYSGALIDDIKLPIP